MAKKKTTTKRKKKDETLIEKIEEKAIEIKDEVEEKVESLDVVKKFEDYVKKLEDKIKKLEIRIEELVGTYKPYNLDFVGKEVNVININNGNKTIVKPGDKLTLSPNNVYVFELDKEYNNVQLNEPFDHVFEIVSFNGKRVKIRPRNNYVLKSGLPVLLVK
jgi:hypothetical protein